MKGNSLWCAVDRRQEVDYMAQTLARINWTSHWATFELCVKYVIPLFFFLPSFFPFLQVLKCKVILSLIDPISLETVREKLLFETKHVYQIHSNVIKWNVNFQLSLLSFIIYCLCMISVKGLLLRQ